MMTCDEAGVKLHALLDGELGAAEARELEAHLAGCARCSAELSQFRAMRQAIKRADLTTAAPAALRARIEAALPTSAPPKAGASRRSLLQGFAIGAALSAIAATGAVVVVASLDREDPVLGDAVTAHLRSLQQGRLTAVAANDRNAIGPWFNGKLPITPPVIDLSGQGFALQGARLDHLDGKAVAALVYRRGAHVINLFVAAAANRQHVAAKSESVQGLNTQRWSDEGMRFIAISDLSADELKDFHQEFEAKLRAGA